MTIGTPMVIFCCFDCLLTVFDDWYTVGSLGRPVTIGIPMVIFMSASTSASAEYTKPTGDWYTGR